MARQNGPQFNRRSTAAKLRRVLREVHETMQRTPANEIEVRNSVADALSSLEIAIHALDSEVERRRAIRAQLEEPTCP